LIRYGKIILRAIETEDLPALKNWRNDKELRKHFREYRELNNENQLRWFEKKVVQDNSTIMFAICDKDNRLIGACGLCYINWIQRSADLSLYVGLDGLYIDEEGFAEDATKALMKYAFHELGLVKIWTEIYEYDIKKKSLLSKLGFSVDGLLRKQHFYDGTWWNSILLSIIDEDYNHKYHKS